MWQFIKIWWAKIRGQAVDLTEVEKKALEVQHLEEIYAQVKSRFYQELDIPALFEEPIPGGLEKLLPWVSIIITAITLVVLLFKK